MTNEKPTIVAVLKADEIIGTGHLMRVKTILNYFKDYNLALVGDSLSEALLTRIICISTSSCTLHR